MRIVVDQTRLQWEMVRRGWSAADLARRSGLSPSTVGAALAGRALSAASIRRMVVALSNGPILDGIDSLFRADDGRDLS